MRIKLAKHFLLGDVSQHHFIIISNADIIIITMKSSESPLKAGSGPYLCPYMGTS